MDALKQMVIDYYKQGIYKDSDLPTFVAAGWITQAEADALIQQG